MGKSQDYSIAQTVIKTKNKLQTTQIWITHYLEKARIASSWTKQSHNNKIFTEGYFQTC